MEYNVEIHKKLNREQNYWVVAMGGIMLALVFSVFLAATNDFSILGIFLLVLTVCVEVYCIIKLAQCSKALDTIGMEIATTLADSCNTQKDLKSELVKIGIAKNLALNYSIRVLGPKRVEKTVAKTATFTKPSTVQCPQCHAQQVHVVAQKKTSLGATFYIWLILSVLGYSFSTLVTVIMLAVFLLTVAVRIVESMVAKRITSYCCDRCGHRFDITNA